MAFHFRLGHTGARRLALGVLIGLVLAPSAATQSDQTSERRLQEEFLRSDGKAPVDYIVSRLQNHRVILLGEAHWIRHDAELLSALVPRLSAAGVTTFAAEWLPAAAQTSIDSVVSALSWNEASALSILRLAAWPYRQYLDVLRAAWASNRTARAARQFPPLRVLALGPSPDWRAQLLPLGRTYESYMSDRVLERLQSEKGKMVVALGFHHSFTRFLMPDLPEGTRATRFNDRTGNMLWRALGQDVFLIALHHPWQCRIGEGKGRWTRCLPVFAAIDCAASAQGRPVGFNVWGSPFGKLRVDSTVWYGVGSPYVRLDQLVDGYIWTAPIERYAAVDLIPLSVFAPNDASLKEVLANNPVTDGPVRTRAALDSLWQQEAARLRDAQRTRGWETLAGWRATCSAD